MSIFFNLLLKKETRLLAGFFLELEEFYPFSVTTLYDLGKVDALAEAAPYLYGGIGDEAGSGLYHPAGEIREADDDGIVRIAIDKQREGCMGWIGRHFHGEPGGIAVVIVQADSAGSQGLCERLAGGRSVAIIEGRQDTAGDRAFEYAVGASPGYGEMIRTLILLMKCFNVVAVEPRTRVANIGRIKRTESLGKARFIPDWFIFRWKYLQRW